MCHFYDKSPAIVNSSKEKQTEFKEDIEMFKKLLQKLRESLNAPMAYKDVSPWNTAQVY